MNKQAKLNNVSTNSKANKDFMILSALGILFVVDSHLGNGMLLFGNIFPYNSFYMPMFMFISGYFFNPRHIDDWKSIYHYSTSKFIKHILPYLGWIVFYGILTFLLRCLNITEIGSISFIDLVHNILTAGTSFGFNDPSWFVPLLFRK